MHIRGVERHADLQPGQQVDRVHQDDREAEAAAVRDRRRERLINERFKGKAYEWLDYRFDQRGYLARSARSERDAARGAVHRLARGRRARSRLTRTT